MPYEEPQLNGRLAHFIREYTADLRWDVREESRGALVDAPLKKPDIVVRRNEASPLVIENEYYPGDQLEDDCVGRLGKVVDAPGGDLDGRVTVVFGVRSPAALNACRHAAEADALLGGGIELEYAVYSSKNSKWTRFPKRGFVRGDLRAFVDFMKPASVPHDVIDAAANALTNGANRAAKVLVDHGRDSGFGAEIGEMLRQPWPTFSEFPEAKAEIKQYRADEEARSQTAAMCAVILINALAYQQNLSSYHASIDDISQVLERHQAGTITKKIVVDEWARILEVNFWPIFHIARQLLLKIPNRTARQILGNMASTADQIETAMRWHDVAGIVFQRMIADRKTLKTHYTLPASTVLLANLGVHEDFDWSDPAAVKRYHIADYACGTGGLVLAAYQRVRDLHRSNGGSPDDLHPFMMQNSITACDVMPAAVHLTSSLLSSAAPHRVYEGTRSILYPYGGRQKVNDKGDPVRDESDQPVLVRNSKGVPEVDIGSLELLGIKSAVMQSVLPQGQQQVMGARGETKPIQVDLAPQSADLVIMNPPFTSPTKSAPRNPGDPVEPRNPAYAAFGISKEEQDAMAKKTSRLGSGTASDGNAGFASSFTAIAHNMVRVGGRIALVLPTSAMMGGSYDAEKDQAFSWQRVRNLLCEEYGQAIVVSVNQPAAKDAAFSADSDFADCMVVARRTETPPIKELVHFVNLEARPNTMLEAQEVARSIRQAVNQTTKEGALRKILVGDDPIGSVSLVAVEKNRPWTGVRIADPELHRRARDLCRGALRLPQRSQSISIPFASLSSIARVGPIARDLTENGRGPFTRASGCPPGAEFPALWSHAPVGKERAANLQDSMLTDPDSHLLIKDSCHDDAHRIWSAHASRLHVSVLVRFNANATAAAWTERSSLGGRIWPTLRIDDEDHGKALCAWMNSTLGMIVYWIKCNRGQDGRGQSGPIAIKNLPVLDVRALRPDRLAAAVKIFDDFLERKMKPVNEARDDEVRKSIDRRILMEVLGTDEDAVEKLDLLRVQWCLEPTVAGTKRAT